MADPEPGEETDAPAGTPDFSANALRRQPATIEGTAQDLTPPAPATDEADSAAEATADAANVDVVSHLDELDRPPEALTSEPAPETADENAPLAWDEPQDLASSTSRRGGILARLLTALIVGAAAGLGGAYAWHAYLDRSDEKIDALSEQVSTLMQQQMASAGMADAQTDLAKRLKTVEAVAQADETALAGIRSEIEKLAARAPVAGGAAPDLGPLTQELSALQQRLTALTGEVGTLSAKVETQKSEVAATQHLVTQTAAAHADDTAVAIITGSLLRKVEAGAPFAEDLSALASRGIDKAQLAALAPAATTGVATPGALAKQFAAATDAILSTAPAPKAHGFFDRLVKDAEGLVQIRKVGDTNGDSLAAHVERIQNALDGGSVETAYQQWTALPAAAKEKSQAFGAAAKLRLDVIEAARAIEAEALAALGKAKS